VKKRTQKPNTLLTPAITRWSHIS